MSHLLPHIFSIRKARYEISAPAIVNVLYCYAILGGYGDSG
jgi:hypothetical protein